MRSPAAAGVQVGLIPTLAGELPGVREFMRSYRYTCLEQLASQAVALRDEARWNGVMASLPSYLDRDGFAMYFPGMWYGSDALTVYLLNIANEAGWQIPADAREPHADRAGALRQGPGGARSGMAHGRSQCAQGRRVAGAGALGAHGRGRRSRVDLDRAQSVADLGGDRLVRSAQARARS